MAPGAKKVSNFTGQLMTADEVADLLRINKNTVYQLIKNGKIPYFRVGSHPLVRTPFIALVARQNGF